MERVLDLSMFETLAERIENLGFKYVTLDMKGFRSGSMN
jgi:PP-loop superfamily ATP-utilizing enzyme